MKFGRVSSFVVGIALVVAPLAISLPAAATPCSNTPTGIFAVKWQGFGGGTPGHNRDIPLGALSNQGVIAEVLTCPTATRVPDCNGGELVSADLLPAMILNSYSNNFSHATPRPTANPAIDPEPCPTFYIGSQAFTQDCKITVPTDQPFRG